MASTEHAPAGCPPEIWAEFSKAIDVYVEKWEKNLREHIAQVDDRQKFYSPDQERDERGRFEDGGGGSSSGESTTERRDRLYEEKKTQQFERGMARRSIASYCQNSHEGVNGYLRGFRNTSGVAREDAKDIVEGMKYAFTDKGLHDTFEKNSTLYRGIESQKVFSALRGAPLGKIITDKAFVSTSTLESDARHFASGWKGEGRVMLTIFADKGEKFLHGRGDERERILENGSRFRIINKTMTTDADGKLLRVSVRKVK